MPNPMPLLGILLASAPARAETEADAPRTSAYVAAGLSLSNTGSATIGASSFLSTEFGACRDAGCLALVTGRTDNDYSGPFQLDDHWLEARASLQAPLGDFSGYGLLGVGNYLSTDRLFIEYGAGMRHTWDDLSVFAHASNRDGVWYLTPGLMLTL
ncbi:MAG: hypothetical protein VX000_16765 [Myxococcota bacterium]|nr:hypothetical protein [Myxococcota bacterium]